MRKLALIALVGAGLSGCVAIDASGSSTSDEIERLAKDCRERGGILVPSGRTVPAANEAANWACQISGGGSRIQK